MGRRAQGRVGRDTAAIERKKKRSLQEARTEPGHADVDILGLFDGSQPQKEYSFENPAPLPGPLKEEYEMHKKKLAVVEGPYIVRTSGEESNLIFLRLHRLRLRKRDWSNPRKNADLFPEKEVLVES